MIIKKRRINSVEKYLKAIINVNEFYICIPNTDANRKVLEDKQVCSNVCNGTQFIPNAVGPVTGYNTNGKRVVRKDLEKEARSFEHDFHIVDWHGQDHYGSCYQCGVWL